MPLKDRAALKRYRVAYHKAHRDELISRRRWFNKNLDIIRRAQGCDLCGTHDGKLLHHHIDPSTKSRDVGRMATSSLETFIDEIAKCCVLCWSCHATVHHRGRNFRPSKYDESLVEPVLVVN